MKEINIGKMLMIKRKERGITQDELAAYVGVTKASVSKWETGQSYPDITYLPQLAAYFNISIDELVGYEPQMTGEDIKKLYHRLSSRFGSEPFDEVIEECREIIKKYYSCFPLLLQMAILMANHYMLGKEREGVLEEVIGLCRRVKTESEDLWLSKQANSIEAICCLHLGHPMDVLELLEEIDKPPINDEVTLAQAYQMIGNTKKANEVLQISIYSDLIRIVCDSSIYLMLHVHKGDKFEEILHRILSISELFDLDRLHPDSMLKLYATAAQGYVVQQNNERALDMLKKYADICTSDSLNLSLHGDEFFDCIEGCFDELDLGRKSPRDERVIKESMVQFIVSNPAFSVLAEEPGYKSIVEKLKSKLKVK